MYTSHPNKRSYPIIMPRRGTFASMLYRKIHEGISDEDKGMNEEEVSALKDILYREMVEEKSHYDDKIEACLSFVHECGRWTETCRVSRYRGYNSFSHPIHVSLMESVLDWLTKEGFVYVRRDRDYPITFRVFIDLK